MTAKHHILTATLLIGLALSGIAQPIYTTDTIYYPPRRPVFDLLTVNPTTGATTLYWTPSVYDPTGTDPQLPRPEGYIIYRYGIDSLGNKGFFAIDTVSYVTRTYTDPTANGNLARQQYRIAAIAHFVNASHLPHDVWKTSPQTTSHGSLWLTSAYDSCNSTLNLYWDTYIGWSNETHETHYNLYHSNFSDIGSFTLLDTIGRFDRRYTIRNIDPNADHYFYITSSRTDTSLTTTSNMHHIFTKQVQPPSSITLDSVIAGLHRTELHFSIDPNTDINQFQVMRWEEPDTNLIVLSANTVTQFDSPTVVYAVDSTDAVAARMRTYYYKVDAVNPCGMVSAVSNLCNTIIPTADAEGTTVHLRWTPLLIDTQRKPSRAGNTVRYTVYRMALAHGVPIETEGPWTRLSTVEQPNLDDDVSAFQFQNPAYQFTFKYYVEAREHTPTDDVVTLSRSRVMSIDVAPNIVLPNAIAPMMTTMVNGRSRSRFEPIINFEAEFTLTIYDRWGKVVYHGNTGWDGRMPNGTLAREGTYAYRLEVFTQRVGNFTRQGSVSVVYP